ncbi:MAG: DUF4007 family protein [Methyloprofundus sp.]|nr:DUF4007 family protein [Methyloprofundus sp.]
MDSLIKPLTPQKAAFGRHETFALRYGWLTKGFQALQENPGVFNSDASTVTLGVGKNMVNAIRYWLRATQMIEVTDDGLQATELGTALFAEEGGWDPYLEDEATLWLVHWMLATNSELATAWYWFFNCFHKTEFNNEEVANDLATFVSENFTAKHSERTVKHDINVILKMYCQVKQGAKVEMEDILDAPLASLKLVTASKHTHYYQCRNTAHDSLPIAIIAFAVNEVFNQRKASVLPIADLMYGDKFGVAVGGVFKLTEGELLAKLERVVEAYPALFNINETAGINQLYRQQSELSSLNFLGDYFENKDKATS